MTEENIKETTVDVEEKDEQIISTNEEIVSDKNETENIICAEDAEPVVTVVDTTTENESINRFSFMKKGDVYEFVVVDESGANPKEYKYATIPSVIIGEVDSVNNNMVRLSAWTYRNELNVIRSSSEISVISYKPVRIDEWYKFVTLRLKSLEPKEMTEGLKVESDEYKSVEHNLAKHIVEDCSKGFISLVCKKKTHMDEQTKNRYFIYPIPAQSHIFPEEPFCEVTDYIPKIVKDEDAISKVFTDNYMELLDWHTAVDKIKNSLHSIIENAFDEKNDKEYHSTKEALNAFVGDGDTNESKPSSDESLCKTYENAKAASEDIDEDSNEAYIVINKKDDNTAYLTTTDDIQSILHSRKIVKNNKTLVIGPLKNCFEGNIIEIPLNI